MSTSFMCNILCIVLHIKMHVFQLKHTLTYIYIYIGEGTGVTLEWRLNGWEHCTEDADEEVINNNNKNGGKDDDDDGTMTHTRRSISPLPSSTQNADAKQIQTNRKLPPTLRTLSNTLSLSVAHLDAHELVQSLQDRVALSAGSACHSRRQSHEASMTSSIDLKPSYVLEAMQVPRHFALGTIRLSIGRCTTTEDIETAAQIVVSAITQQLHARAKSVKM